MGGCADFFTEHETDKDRCKALQSIKAETLLAWEQECASEHSPGPVYNSEILYRQMLNPTHYDPVNKILKVTAFSDTSDKGGSVNRANHVTKVEVLAAAQRRVAQINERKTPGSEVELWQLIELNCSDVRAILTPSNSEVPNSRAFGVYDTALEHDRSHADICQIVSGKETGRSVRSKLLDLANTFLQKQSS